MCGIDMWRARVMATEASGRVVSWSCERYRAFGCTPRTRKAPHHYVRYKCPCTHFVTDTRFLRPRAPPSLGGTMARGTMSPKRDVRPNLAMVSSLCILLVFCFAHLRFGRTPAPRCVPHKQGKACRGGPITSAVYALFTIVSQTLVPPGPDVGGLGFRFRELGQKHD